MLILILIEVQFLQKVFWAVKKGSNGQNYSSSGSDHRLMLYGKPCTQTHTHTLTQKYILTSTNMCSQQLFVLYTLNE